MQKHQLNNAWRLYIGRWMTPLSLIALLCLIIPFKAHATDNSIESVRAVQKVVTGTILDENDEPIIGASIVVKGTSIGTVSDLDGRFSLNVPDGKKIITISYMGYVNQDVNIDNKKSLLIRLKPDAKLLDEVVVVGYGTVKKRDLTGAISSVKSEDIKASPVTNAMEGLAGKVSGLDITRESGSAGSSPTILLRGNRSLTASSSPLFIVDGIAADGIDNLNPNDIESIEVLKDASSTAIYGAAGANGVIIVTTKQGQTGKVSVDANIYVGINAFPSYPSTLSGQKWIDYLTEGYKARYGELPESDEVLFNTVLGTSTNAQELIANEEWVDWKDEILHTGSQQNYNVSVRGGTEKLNSYMSMGYQVEKGLYKNDDCKIYTMRAGGTYNYNKYVSTGMQVNLSWRDQNNRNSRLSKTLNAIPLGRVYDEDGSINLYPIEGNTSFINILADDQPYAYKRNRKQLNVSANPYIQINPVKGLSWRSVLGVNIGSSRTGTWDGLDTYMKLSGSQTNVRSATYATSLYYSYTWQNIVNYNLKINDNNEFTVTGITEWNHSQSENSTAYNEQFDYDNFLWYNLNSGLNASTFSGYSMTKKMSYAGRINYNLMDRYLLSATTRWDGASQLYNKWCAFPAFALAWRLSDEPFMAATQSWLSNLKIRLGYGVTGNANINPYVTLTEVESSANLLNLGSGQLPSYILKQNIVNMNLTWEKSYNWNIGLDFAFLDNRIDGSLELYKTDSKGVLYNRPLATAFGAYNAKSEYKMMSNIARIKNKGIELTINSRNIMKRNFSWNTTFTFAKNDEKIKEIDMGNNVTVNDLIALNLFMNNPVNTIYGYKKLGIWQKGDYNKAVCFGQTVGDVRLDIPGLTWDENYTYTVKNGETGEETEMKGAYLKTTYNDKGEKVDTYYTGMNTYTTSTNDKQILGSKTPKWSMGMQNTFQFYNVDVSVMMTARWGQWVNGELLGYFANSPNIPECYDYWTEDNPTNAYPRPTLGKSSATAFNESLYYAEGSFFKIRNITVGYTLPARWANKLDISTLRVYGTITNPLVVAKSSMLKGMDPESNASDRFPLYKTIVFGLNLSF